MRALYRTAARLRARDRLGRARRGNRALRAMRQVHLRELEQRRVELLALVVAQRREELVLELRGELAQPTERGLALRREAYDVAAAVGRVAAPLHETALLELVEEPDQLALVVAERVG